MNIPATFSSSAAISSAEAIFLEHKHPVACTVNRTNYILNVISKFSKTTPELCHVVGDGVEIHQGRRQIADAFTRVQSVHYNLSVTENKTLTILTSIFGQLNNFARRKVFSMTKINSIEKCKNMYIL